MSYEKEAKRLFFLRFAGRWRLRYLNTMLRTRVILAFLLTPVTTYATPHDAGHDPRPLTARELRVFMPLVCENAQKTGLARSLAYVETPAPSDYRCDRILGRFDQAGRGLPTTGSIALSAIAYGDFTGTGLDEAYISYDGLESHADLFGGGILFARKHGHWRLVTWVPAERRQRCVTLPDSVPEEMLCLDSDAHMDSSYEAIGITLTAQHVDAFGHASGEAKTSYKLAREVVAVRDNSGCENLDDQAKDHNRHVCAMAQQGIGILYGIRDLQRSSRPGMFAEASVAYMAPDTIAQACQATCYLDAPVKQGSVFFTLRGKTVNVTTPRGLNLQWAFPP